MAGSGKLPAGRCEVMVRAVRVFFPVSLAVALVFLALAALPALAQLYTWTDEKGVVHMTDRKDKVPAGKGTEIKTPSSSVPGESGRAAVVRSMLTKAKDNPRLMEIKNLAAEYHRNHTYSKTDYFVCVDMALEMANMLKTRQFNTKVVAGTFNVDIAGMSPEKMRNAMDHAWVVVELDPGVNIAVETTAGVVADENIKNFEYYYQGLVFKDSKQAKDTDILMRTFNEDCTKARELIQEWNARYEGRPATAQALEAKGRVEAKVNECTGAKDKYAALIKEQFRKLY